MRAKIGERVGAIRNADGKTVWLYGYGVYDGHHEPPFGPFPPVGTELIARPARKE